jgi:hypothetical protein
MRRNSRLGIGNVYPLSNQISCVVFCLKGDVDLAFAGGKRPHNSRQLATVIAR